MRTLFLLLAIIVSTLNLSYANTQSNIPDFAYPKTVINQSEKQIDKAIKNGNDIVAIRALMDYAIAKSLISSDNIPDALEQTKELKSKLSNHASKAILSLIEADIYLAIYTKDRYKYNDRRLPLHPHSDAYNQ